MSDNSTDDTLRRWADDVRTREGDTPEYDFRLATLADEARRPQRRTTVLLAAAAVVVVAGSITALVSVVRDPAPKGPSALTAPASSPSMTSPSPIPSSSANPGPTARKGCPATKAYGPGVSGIGDFVNFVYLHRHTYLGRNGLPISTTTRNRLGRPVAHVTCEVSTLDRGGRAYIVGPFRNGNAAFLPVDTPLYRVRGYPSTCRVAAIWNRRIYEYLAQSNAAHHATPLRCATEPAH